MAGRIVTADRNIKAMAEELRTLAHRVGILTVSSRNPDKFFEDRSQVRADLRAFADRLEKL
jgi:hypothetical protein